MALGLLGIKMHRLNLLDAWILLAIYRAGKQHKLDYAAIVSCLPDVSLPVPTHQEFKNAYNKFLYIKFIVADGANTALSPAAQQLVESSMPIAATTANAIGWVEALNKTLSIYKFSSICNRHEWQEDQYAHGLELLTETTRR